MTIPVVALFWWTSINLDLVKGVRDIFTHGNFSELGVTILVLIVTM